MFKNTSIRILQIIIIFIAIFAINSVSGLVKADIHKKEGKESLKKSFPYLAGDKFSKALKLDNSDGEARGYLGMSYINLAEKTNNFKEKENQFKKAIYEIKDSRKTYETPSINYNLAKAYELSGDIDSAIQEAIKSYNQIPSGQTKDKLIALYKIKGDILLAQNKKDEAIKYYTKFVELKGLNVTNEDIIDYEFLRSLIPDNFFVRYGLAGLYREQGLWDKVVIELEYIKKNGIFNESIKAILVYAYYKLGTKHYDEKKFKEAEGYFNNIINIAGIDSSGYGVGAINSLSKIYEQVGNIDKAVEMLMKLEGIDTQKGQGYYQIGNLFNRKSNPQKAIEYFEKYLPYRPISDTGVFFTLGNLYEQMGDINKAVETLMKLEGFDTQKGQGYYQIGNLFNRKSNLRKAIEYFEKYLPFKPVSDVGIFITLGSLYERIGNIDKAVETLMKLEGIDTQKGQGYYQIGQLFVRQTNPQKAIEYFERYLSFHPISEGVYLFTKLGELYKQIGNIDKAVEYYSKLENINSHKGQGHYYIGLLYEIKERWTDALKEFEYVSMIRPYDSEVLLRIGKLYDNIGDDKKAIEVYKKIIDIDPSRIEELNPQIAKLYEKTGEREKALSIFKKGRML